MTSYVLFSYAVYALSIFRKSQNLDKFEKFKQKGNPHHQLKLIVCVHKKILTCLELAHRQYLITNITEFPFPLNYTLQIYELN